MTFSSKTCLINITVHGCAHIFIAIIILKSPALCKTNKQKNDTKSYRQEELPVAEFPVDYNNLLTIAQCRDDTTGLNEVSVQNVGMTFQANCDQCMRNIISRFSYRI